MIRLVQRKLIIPRGDTGNFSLPVPKEANTGDVAVFTIIDPRTNTKVYEKITEPVEQLITIVFTHNDTVNLPVGRYLWDVKFYVNPTFADEKLVNGDEVDSYYAAYTLPECEVRQTGDDLMTSDDSPSSTLTPESLNIITAAITEATQAKNAAAESAAEAQGYVEQITGLSAEAETLPAGASATAAYDAETGVLTLGLPRGDAFSVAKTYPTIAAMNADYSGSDTSVGDFVMIVSTIGDPDNAKLYVKGAERFEFVVDMSGANGVGVQSIVKSGTVENVDTYTITYTDGTTTTYNVVNGVDGDEYTVMVQDTQPTQETNKLWIPIQAGVVQEVPTVAEMQVALNGKADKTDTVLETTLSKGRKTGTTVGESSFAFGFNVEASGTRSTAFGNTTKAIGNNSFAEGNNTTASGVQSHAEGQATVASGDRSHAEGSGSIAAGGRSHVEGNHTIASSNDQHVQGKYNVADAQSIYTHIVGNGTADNTRSNAYALDWDGNGHFAGDVYVGANADSTGGTKLAKITDIPSAPVQDVQVNGISVLNQGVANVPMADSDTYGVMKVGDGLKVSSQKVMVSKATDNYIKGGTNNYSPIVPDNQHKSAFYALAKASGDTTQSASSNAVGTYTENAKSKISEMLSSPVSVTGTTPTITALSGIQYVCGEVSTLDIVLPASGIVDVVFQSSSTPTVLTITPQTGMTVEWANGFDSTALDADTLYELNIKMVGTKCLGVAGTWS